MDIKIINNSIDDIFKKIENTNYTEKFNYNLKNNFIINKSNTFIEFILSDFLSEINSSSTTHYKVKNLSYDTFKEKLLFYFKDEDFEYGKDTKSDAFIREQIKNNNIQTKQFLNQIFIESFHNAGMIISILRILARLNFEDVHPNGETMAIAALTHADLEVKECAIRVIESWENKEYIPLLRKIDTNVKWIQDYISTIIADLEEI